MITYREEMEGEIFIDCVVYIMVATSNLLCCSLSYLFAAWIPTMEPQTPVEQSLYRVSSSHLIQWLVCLGVVVVYLYSLSTELFL